MDSQKSPPANAISAPDVDSPPTDIASNNDDAMAAVVAPHQPFPPPSANPRDAAAASSGVGKSNWYLTSNRDGRFRMASSMRSGWFVVAMVRMPSLWT